MKKIAVVILNWNGRELMETFLPSLIAHSPEELAEVVVADNGSTDDSVVMLKKKFPMVKVILLDRNYGFAEGYNKALEEISTEYTVLLNSDVEVTAGWLDAPLKLLEEELSVAGVQPKIKAQRDKSFFEYAGAAGGYIDRYGYPFCRGRVMDVVEEDKGQYNTQADVLWASGACLFIRTAIYKKEGGLDGNFFAHQEEVDLCWRLRCRGYRLVCTPDSVVYHVGGATLQAENPRKTFLNFRNNLLMLYKNLPEKQLKPVMRIRFLLDYLAALQFLLTGQVKSTKAVYQARQAFYSMRNEYISIRKENMSKTVINNIPEILPYSLLFRFYLQGKKTFSALIKR